MQKLRQKKNSLITSVLFGIIILTFVLWGGEQASGPSTTSLTTVNGEEVSYRDFQRILQGQLESYGQALGGGKPLSDSLVQIIERQVASGLVMQTVLAQEARKVGIVISDKEVLDQLSENTAFHDSEKGRFSPSIYTRILEANNIQPSHFESSIRTDIASERMRHLIENSILISDRELEDAYRIQNQKILLDIATYDTAVLKKAGRIKVSDAEAREYFEKHKGEFLTALRRKSMVATLSPEDLASSAIITDDEVQSFYETQVKDSKEPTWSIPQAHAYHLLISDTSEKGKVTASALLKSIRSSSGSGGLKAAFQQAAALNSEDYSNASRGGDLGYFSSSTMVKPFADAVFRSAKTGSIVGPVKTDFGYHLIYIEDLTGSRNSLSQRRKQIDYNIRRTKASDELKKIEASVASLLKKNDASVIESLRKLGFKVSETKAYDPQSRVSDLPYLLQQESFQAPLKTWMGPKSLQGSLYAFQVTEELNPKQMEYAEAKPQLERKMESALVEKVVKAEQDALRSGKITWTSLATKGAALNSHKDFKVFEVTSIPGLGESESIMRAVQGLTTEQPISSPLIHEGKWMIFKASQMSDLKGEIPAATKSKLREDLLSKKKVQMLNAFLDGIVKSARIPEDFRKKYNL